MKKLTKKELGRIKESYHIGDNRYTWPIYVEKLVSEVERLWEKEKKGKPSQEQLGAVIYLLTVARCAADPKVPYKEVRKMATKVLEELGR